MGVPTIAISGSWSAPLSSMAPPVLAPTVESIRDCLWYAKRLYQGEGGGEALVAVLVHEDGDQDAASWRWACLRRQPYTVTRGRRRAHQAVARGDHKFSRARLGYSGWRSA